MASKLNPNVLYVAEHGEALGSPQADSERTSMVSERPLSIQVSPNDMLTGFSANRKW